LDKKLVLYPDSKIITLKQGEAGDGFALSLKNVDQGAGSAKFGYTVVYDTSQKSNCGSGNPITTFAKIDVGQNANGIPLANGNSLSDPIFVRLTISETAPICTFRLRIDVTKDSQAYEVGFMDIKIVSK